MVFNATFINISVISWLEISLIGQDNVPVFYISTDNTCVSICDTFKDAIILYVFYTI